MENPQVQFLEKIKVTDMLVGMQHQEPVIQKVTAGVPQVRSRGQGGRESCLQRPVHTRE